MSDKALFIAEKPSVAQEFAKALKYNMKRANGYLESEEAVITWCVGHLVSMSYPDKYSPELKHWSFETIPFIPDEFKYEIIPSAAAQFKIVSSLLNRADIKTIYVCTDSGREGEYIYRLVRQEAGVQKHHRQQFTHEERMAQAIQRIEQHGFITLTDYANMNSMSRSMASRELKAFEADPACPIKAKGTAPHKVWCLEN